MEKLTNYSALKKKNITDKVGRMPNNNKEVAQLYGPYFFSLSVTLNQHRGLDFKHAKGETETQTTNLS